MHACRPNTMFLLTNQSRSHTHTRSCHTCTSVSDPGACVGAYTQIQFTAITGVRTYTLPCLVLGRVALRPRHAHTPHFAHLHAPIAMVHQYDRRDTGQTRVLGSKSWLTFRSILCSKPSLYQGTSAVNVLRHTPYRHGNNANHHIAPFRRARPLRGFVCHSGKLA